MMDGFPEELREVVNEHWEKYPPQNPLVMAFFCILFFVLWIVAFFGNFCELPKSLTLRLRVASASASGHYRRIVQTNRV